MEKPFNKNNPKQQLKREMAKLNERYKASKNRNHRFVEGTMQLGKNELKKIAGVVMLIVFILIEGVSILSNDLFGSTQHGKTDQITSLLLEQQTLTAIDTQRRSSVNKIVAIMSRYNKRMSDGEKYAIANEIFEMTHKYPNLNEDFICATITHESAKSWNPRVISPVGAMGLMQIMPATGAFLAAQEGIDWTTPEQVLYNPILNIRLGCRYLSELVDMYQVDGGLAAYNGGPKRAALWLASNRNDSTLFAETRQYVPAVRKLYDQFRREGVM